MNNILGIVGSLLLAVCIYFYMENNTLQNDLDLANKTISRHEQSIIDKDVDLARCDASIKKERQLMLENSNLKTTMENKFKELKQHYNKPIKEKVVVNEVIKVVEPSCSIADTNYWLLTRAFCEATNDNTSDRCKS